MDEVLEHLTLTNRYLMLVIRKGCDRALRRAARGAPEPETESDLTLLDPIGRRGSFTWERPEHMVPSGTRPPGEIRHLMREQVRECLDILGRLAGGPGALHRVRMSVNDSGKLDLYQWLYFLAQHARRHLAQMAANKSEWLRLRPRSHGNEPARLAARGPGGVGPDHDARCLSSSSSMTASSVSRPCKPVSTRPPMTNIGTPVTPASS